ncbi:hypothetical protein V8C34DRAFT_173404 [Trichoderma compactum]
MGFNFASVDSSLIRDFSSPSAFKRLYYPPISNTRLRISGLRILAYAGRSDETCPTYTINSYLFIFGRCVSPSWRHLKPDSFGGSRKRKPADLIPFVSPFPSFVIIFLSFSSSFLFLPPLIPKILCTIVSAFSDKLWIVGHGLGVLLDGFSMSSVASVRVPAPSADPPFFLIYAGRASLVFLEGRAYNRATRKKILESKGREASFGEDFESGTGGEGMRCGREW